MQENTLTVRRRRCATIGKFFAASILAAPCVLAAGADAPSAPSGASEQLPEIVITGHYEFLSVDTSGTTNLPLPIEKVPQSISLVSEDFIKAADLKDIGDIADYVPGLVNQGPGGGFAPVVTLRGFFPLKSDDGINIGAAGLPAFEPDYGIFDRVEVVKGPSSVVYGVSSAGGLINYVTKSATPQTLSYLTAQSGLWDSYRVEGQVAGSLDSSDRVRAIGMAIYDKGNSFVDVINHQTTTFYGGINADLSSSVTAYLHGGYERWVRTASDGLSTYPDGTYPSVSRGFFLGSKDDNFTSPAYIGTMGLTWHATDMLELNLKSNYERTNSHGFDPFSYQLQPNGDLQVNKQDIKSQASLDYGIAFGSIYKLDALGLKNSFVSLGAMYQDSKFKYIIYGMNFPNGQPIVTGNINAGEAALTRLFDSANVLGALQSDQHEFLTTLSYSMQSVLHVVDSVAVLLGASYAKPDVKTLINNVISNLSPAGQVSYRGGLTYEFSPGANAYLSYSESFIPQLLFEPNFSVLPPLFGKQYEGGVKYRTLNGRLLLTGALFQINETNQPIFAELIGSGSYYLPAGEVQHKGLEFEALGQLTRDWQIHFSYAYLDPKITKNPGDPTTVGQIEPFNPEQTASLFSTYTVSSGFLRGLTFGGGARYVGPQRTNIPNNSTLDLPAYELVDASVSYAINKWSVQLNAHNILNKFYFYNDYQTLSFSNRVGPPFNVALTVRHNF